MGEGRRRSPIAIVLLLLLFCPTVLRSARLTITNNCLETVWPVLLSNFGTEQMLMTGFPLSTETSRQVELPANWTGRVWGRTRCSIDRSGQFLCLSGGCHSRDVECSDGGPSGPATLAEFALNGWEELDLYGVSLADGFNLPMLVAPQGRAAGSCAATGCLADLNGICPSELSVTAVDGVVACKSACQAFRTPRYCCVGAYGNPRTCTPTNYSLIFNNACPMAYSYTFDPSPNTFNCSAANYRITFCPFSSRFGAVDLSQYGHSTDLKTLLLALSVSFMSFICVYLGSHLLIKLFHHRKIPIKKATSSNEQNSGSIDNVRDAWKWFGETLGGLLIATAILLFHQLAKCTNVTYALIIGYVSSYLIVALGGFLLIFCMTRRLFQDAESNVDPPFGLFVPESCKWLFNQGACAHFMGITGFAISDFVNWQSSFMLLICSNAMFIMTAIKLSNVNRTNNANMSSDIVPKCCILPHYTGVLIFFVGMNFLLLPQNMLSKLVIGVALLDAILGLVIMAFVLWTNLQDAMRAEKFAAAIVLAILFISIIVRVIEIVHASGEIPLFW